MSFIHREIVIFNKEDLFLYLDDIVEYVNSILLYHHGHYDLEIDDILMHLSSIEEIIEAIKAYLRKEL